MYFIPGSERGRDRERERRKKEKTRREKEGQLFSKRESNEIMRDTKQNINTVKERRRIQRDRQNKMEKSRNLFRPPLLLSPLLFLGVSPHGNNAFFFFFLFFSSAVTNIHAHVLPLSQAGVGSCPFWQNSKEKVKNIVASCSMLLIARTIRL